jgi:hypothetical protein
LNDRERVGLGRVARHLLHHGPSGWSKIMMSPFVPLSHTVVDAVAELRARNFRAGRNTLRVSAQGENRTDERCGNGTSAIHAGSFHEGRRPTGLVESAPLALGPTEGDLFAEMSRHAAAAVLAYRELGRELHAFGAPRSLRDRVRRAAWESIRHTRFADGLALRFGAEPERPMVHARRARTLSELARDNAVDGCIREAWSAALALWQAEYALAPIVREAMRDFAHDKMRHAQLAWDIHRWAIGRIEESEVATVDEASRKAIARILRAPAPFLTPAALRNVGLPAPKIARELAHAVLDGIAAEGPDMQVAVGS